MPHFAFIAPPYIGHLNPMDTLARAVRKRGHQVTLLTYLDGQSWCERSGLDCRFFAESTFPKEGWNRRVERMGMLQGLAASRFAIRLGATTCRAALAELPTLLPRLKVDGLVMDQICPGVECVAAHLNLPLAVACNAFPLHIDADVPPYYVGRPYRATRWSRVRNRVENARLLLRCGPIFRQQFIFRRRHRLPWPGLDDFNRIPPSLVQVSQVPSWLDYPRRNLPRHFHYTGPWHEPAEHVRDDAFPWRRLDDRRLIFASVGTLQNRREEVYQTVAEACAGLDAQLVLALGRHDGMAGATYPGNPLVVGYAPQQALIARSALVITHAGLNTTLETLRLGIPMVAIPIANEQPAIAARLELANVAAVIPIQQLTVDKLHTAVQARLSEDSAQRHVLEASKRIRQKAFPLLKASGASRCKLTGRFWPARARRFNGETIPSPRRNTSATTARRSPGCAAAPVPRSGAPSSRVRAMA